MSATDRRPEMRRRAWRSTELSWAEKAYIVRLSELPAEVGDDGKRRFGSRAMDADGFVSLHRDYLAAELGCSEDAVRRAQRGCVAKGYLDLVNDAVNGLPNRLQAFRVGGRFSTGYWGAETASLPMTGRGAETAFLLSKTPDPGDHSGDPGVSPAAVAGQRRSKEERAGHGSFPRPAACEAHGYGDCDDVACSTTAGRKEAS